MARRRNRTPKTGAPDAAVSPRESAPVTAPARGAARFTAPLGVLLLLLAAWALHAGSLRYPLVFDDELLREAYLRASAAAPFRLDMRWFTHASFGWNWTLAGGQHWPGFRLVNVLLHGLSAGMLFLLVRRLVGAVLPAAGQGRLTGADACAIGGALLFALHPVAVYGTAYLVQRSILLATLFSLVSLVLFLEGLLRGPGGRAWPAWACYGAAAVAFFVAAFSKEHCVMLPAVAAAIGLLVRGASLRTLRELLLPVALLGAVSALLLVRKYGLIGAAYEPYAQIMLSGLAESQGAPAGVESAYARSVVNQCWLFFRYLGLWVLPFPGWMSIDMRPDFPSGVFSLPQALGLLPWVAWPGIGLWLLLKGGRRGLAGLAMLFPWLMALTEVATVRVQEPFVLYRSYLWMGGFAALLPAVARAWVPMLDRRLAALVLAGVVLLLVPASLERIGTFASEERVWDDAVKKLPHDKAPLADRTYRARGIAAYRAEHYEPALRDIDRSLAINPKSPESWMLRGMLLMRAGRTPESLEALDRSIALAPNLPEARARRCVVLMRLQRPQEALADCTRAVELHASQPEARHYTSLGMANALLNRPKEAEAMYQMALLVAPGDTDANYQFGVLLMGTGQAERAKAYLQAACTAGLEGACRRLRP